MHVIPREFQTPTRDEALAPRCQQSVRRPDTKLNREWQPAAQMPSQAQIKFFFLSLCYNTFLFRSCGIKDTQRRRGAQAASKNIEKRLGSIGPEISRITQEAG